MRSGMGTRAPALSFTRSMVETTPSEWSPVSSEADRARGRRRAREGPCRHERDAG